MQHPPLHPQNGDWCPGCGGDGCGKFRVLERDGRLCGTVGHEHQHTPPKTKHGCMQTDPHTNKSIPTSTYFWTFFGSKRFTTSKPNVVVFDGAATVLQQCRICNSAGPSWKLNTLIEYKWHPAVSMTGVVVGSEGAARIPCPSIPLMLLLITMPSCETHRLTYAKIFWGRLDWHGQRYLHLSCGSTGGPMLWPRGHAYVVAVVVGGVPLPLQVFDDQCAPQSQHMVRVIDLLWCSHLPTLLYHIPS